MRAYVDSSCLVAIAFGEDGAEEMEGRLAGFERRMSSNLLEAEVRAAFRRERVAPPDDVLDRIDWVLPERALTAELARVLAVSQLKGADAWHIACALHATDSPADLAFLTLDERQRDVAAQLGFPTP